jgi:outer membrane murein-binding lipoprotein Lpp
MTRLPVLVLAGSLVVLSGCVNPRTEANIAQALNDAANEMAGLRNDLATLQTQVDSLREIVAKQDTVIGRIAEVNHIPR